MIRISLQTLWELRAGEDPEAMEMIHDFYWKEMEEAHYGIFYLSGSNKLELFPLTVKENNNEQRDT